MWVCPAMGISSFMTISRLGRKNLGVPDFQTHSEISLFEMRACMKMGYIMVYQYTPKIGKLMRKMMTN